MSAVIAGVNSRPAARQALAVILGREPTEDEYREFLERVQADLAEQALRAQWGSWAAAATRETRRTS